MIAHARSCSAVTGCDRLCSSVSVLVLRADLAPASTLLRVSVCCKLSPGRLRKREQACAVRHIVLLAAHGSWCTGADSSDALWIRFDQMHWSGCIGSDSSRCTGSGASTSGAWLRFAGSCSLDQGQQSSCNSSGTCRGRYSAPHAAAAQHGTLAVFAARLCCTAFLRNFLHNKLGMTGLILFLAIFIGGLS